MKKLLIGAVVGGILLFFWQFLSNSILDLHRPMVDHTPKQEEILKYLSENMEEGNYFLPTLPKGASWEENEKMMEESMGKPWAQVYYHKAMNMDMTANMLRGLAVDFLAVLALAWVLMKISNNNLTTTLLSCLAIGIASYLTTSYANGIWYETVTMPDLIDAIVGWGVVGVWLGWWLNRE
jgi:hypothetical protein